MSGFRINYGQVIAQANRIENLSGDLNREINTLENILNDVRDHWKGPASQAFQSHLTILVSDMKQTESSMLSVSSTIKNVAFTIQQEDERLAELARSASSSKARVASGRK